MATNGGGDAGAGSEVITYRVATIDGIGTPMNDGFDRFVEEVETCSNGRLVGTNYPAGQLGGFIDLIDGNRQGTYEITSGGFDVEGATAPIVSALSLGYLFEDEEHVERVIDEMQGEMAAQLEETTGVTILGMGEDGWRWTFSTKQISTLEDLSGVKIRVPEAEIPLGLWGELGASATPVPFTEIYNGLETGVIEAGESALAQIEANAFWEPAPNLVNTKHWFNIKPVRANSEWFDGLDADLQECLTSVGRSVFADVRQASRDLEAQTLKALQDEGVTVTEEPSDLDEWRARADAYNAEYFAKYPGSEEFITQVKELAN
jgi:TRAP-type C4-dicarboxylate transport system substrate-binding protein